MNQSISEKPNIILISVDQWRGDCLSIDDHPVVHTPFLDQMALHGVRFGRAYAACPVCIPARASLYTGLKPSTHGRVGYEDGVPWNYPTTIAGEFTRHGYQTQAIGKLHVYPERSQMGFQNVILHDGFLHHARRHPNHRMIDDYLPWLRDQLGRDADYFDHGVNCNSIVARPWDKPEYTHPTNFVVSQGIDFLRRRDPRKPFFLYLSFHRPHPPFDPPAWAFEQYLHREMPRPPVGEWSTLFEEVAEPNDPGLSAGQLSPQLLQRARAGYYGHMSHIDHQINRFWEGLGDFSLQENSVLCFVSDHGEMIGDHNLFGKRFPYEGSARVPLILRAPPSTGIRANVQLDELIELRDVMPTLLNCAGLPVPESVEGESFLSLAQGNGAEWRVHLHGELAVSSQSIQWIIDGRFKYVWYGGPGIEQLFDLRDDPQELRDLVGEPELEETLSDLRRLLIEELRGREEGFTDGTKLIAGRPAKAVLSQVRRYEEPSAAGSRGLIQPGY